MGHVTEYTGRFCWVGLLQVHCVQAIRFSVTTFYKLTTRTNWNWKKEKEKEHAFQLYASTIWTSECSAGIMTTALHVLQTKATVWEKRKESFYLSVFSTQGADRRHYRSNLEMLVYGGRGNRSIRRKRVGARTRTKNKLNPHTDAETRPISIP